MRLLRVLFVLVLLAAAAGAFVVLAPFGPSSEQFVDIAPGTTTAEMATQLKQAGIIRSAVAFEAMKAVHGGSLKAGEYRFDHPAALSEVYSRIRRGDVYTVTVVIPEGYNIFDIADAVAKAGLKNRDEFLQAERTNTALIAAWSPHAQSLEGFLFPDTYKFSRRAQSADMLATMVKRFTQMATRLGMEGTASKGADVLRTVTMASLVEREVHVDAERPTVASVFENRLAAGMPLQTDPAVVYASLLRGTWSGVIHQSELHADSPYNTYAHTGLPPGPICNPGVAALKAALHPAHTDFLYFVADAHGQTTFARSLAEHNSNVAAYRAASGEAATVPASDAALAEGQQLAGKQSAAQPSAAQQSASGDGAASSGRGAEAGAASGPAADGPRAVGGHSGHGHSHSGNGAARHESRRAPHRTR